MKKISIKRPDDWHVHFRDNNYLPCTVLATAKNFQRAMVMPNLVPPITNVREAADYQKRILSVLPKDMDFKPCMTLYLTDNTSPESIREAKASGIVYGCKLYPAGATTHSDKGIHNIEKLFPLFAEMEKAQLPLLIHGEVTDPAIDIFHREREFIDRSLSKICKTFTALPTVLEHITTLEAVEFIRSAADNVAATITVHHLRHNRNALFQKGLNPHYYCLPILKQRKHQEALVKAATSGNKKFFLGTDSAPHAKEKKESCCGCAGIFSSPTAMPILAEIFEEQNALQQLENFCSIHGANFYKLPVNSKQLTLLKESWTVPETLPFGETIVIPLAAGETLSWRVHYE